MLSIKKLDALARIQAGISNIERLRLRINEANEANDLGLPVFTMPQLGRLVHLTEGLAFEHALAKEKHAAELGAQLEDAT